MSGMLRIVAVGLVLAAAGGLYGLKHRVEARRAAVEALEQQIRADADAIRVLRAEWAYLTTPAKLESLARDHLALRPPGAAQIASSLAALPFRGRALAAADGLDSAAPAGVPAPRVKPAPPPLPEREEAPLLAGTQTRDGRGKPAAARRGEGEPAFADRVQAILNRLGGEG